MYKELYVKRGGILFDVVDVILSQLSCSYAGGTPVV